jgi:hypothetical protein
VVKVDCRFAERRKSSQNSGFSAAPTLIVILEEREKARNVGDFATDQRKFSKLQTEWRGESHSNPPSTFEAGQLGTVAHDRFGAKLSRIAGVQCGRGR